METKMETTIMENYMEKWKVKWTLGVYRVYIGVGFLKFTLRCVLFLAFLLGPSLYPLNGASLFRVYRGQVEALGK